MHVGDRLGRQRPIHTRTLSQVVLRQGSRDHATDGLLQGHLGVHVAIDLSKQQHWAVITTIISSSMTLVLGIIGQIYHTIDI
jgi:hypothetical protein